MRNKLLGTKITLAIAMCLWTSADLRAQSIPEILAQPSTVAPESTSSLNNPYPYDSKESFLAAAVQGNSWWRTWGFERYTPNNDFPKYARLVARSKTIKRILEHSYKVVVPFDTVREQYAANRQARAYAKSGRPLQNPRTFTWCGALTPYDLSSILAAATAMVAPELTWPDRKPQEVKQYAIQYIQYEVPVLKSYCDPLDRGAFTSAFMTFLTEYQKAILPRYQIEIKAKEREAAMNLAAEAEKEKNAENLRRQAEEQEQKIAAERAKKEQNERAERIQSEAEAEKIRENAAIAEEQREASIKSGALPVKTVSDMALKSEAISGWSIILSPPVTPDKRAYDIKGKLVRRQEDGIYIFEVPLQSDIRYFGAMIPTQAFSDPNFKMRYESCARIVGIYDNTEEYTTVIGETKVMPIFSALGVGNCQ